MLRGVTFACLSYDIGEDFFFSDCKKNGINYYVIESKYWEEFELCKLDEKYLIQAEVYKVEKYEEETDRVARILVDMNIHIVVNFFNDFVPFACLLREKMRKYVDTLDPARKKQIYSGYHCYNFNKNVDYAHANKLINKVQFYKILNDNAEGKNVYSIGSNFDVINDDNYQTFEVKNTKIFKIDNCCGKLKSKSINFYDFFLSTSYLLFLLKLEFIT